MSLKTVVCVVTVLEVVPFANVGVDVAVHLRGSGIDIHMRMEAAGAPPIGQEFMCTIEPYAADGPP